MPRYITKSAHVKWITRIDAIKKEVREVVKEIGTAAEKGDLRENAEYQYAVEHRNRLMQEEIQIRTRLSEVRQFIEDLKLDDEVVDIGTYVLLRKDDGEEFEFAILGCTDDESPKGGKVIPYEAPIARQMLKKNLGESFTVTIPAGTFNVEVVKVEKLFS